MKNKIVKQSKVVAALLGIALLLPAFASAGVKQSPFQGTSRAGIHENLSFYGTAVYRANNTTVPQQLVTGEAFLDMICTVGGTIGAYSLALDSAEGMAGLTVDSWAYAISPQVFVQNGTTSQAPAGCGAGCWCPPFPIRYENGLAGLNSATGHVSLFYVHTSTGTNPGL